MEVIAHDLRRTPERNLERAGISRSVSMSFTGHKTEAVYRQHVVVYSAARREGVVKVAVAGWGKRFSGDRETWSSGTIRAQSKGRRRRGPTRPRV